MRDMQRRHHGALRKTRRRTINPKPDRINVIVAATDFAPTATTAVCRAAQLAHLHGSRIALTHVVTPARRTLTAFLEALGANDRSSPALALSRLRATAARISAEYGIPVDTQLASGDVPGAVATLSQAASADLVVLGNGQSRFLADLLSINTARDVRHRTSVPVLAVSHPTYSCYARVLLLAADLSAETIRAQRTARRLFPGAILTVLHAFEPPYDGLLRLADVGPDAIEDYREKALDEAVVRLCHFARDAAFDEDTILEACLGHPAACTRKQARKLNADVAVLPSPMASSWGAMTSAVIGQLLADPPCDTLLVG